MNGALELCNAISPDKGGSSIHKSDGGPESHIYDVEIIIPVYNVKDFIIDCIESVLNQETNFNYHVVIINDGSTDGSRQLLERYEGDSRITIIDQDNKGFSGARNTGLDNVKARYICFVDSDDRLRPDTIEVLMSKAVKEDLDIVGGGYVVFSGDRYIHENLPKGNRPFGFPWGKVYKARLWRDIRYPENYWFEDTINALVLHDSAKACATVPAVVYEWRKNRKSISFSSVGNPRVMDTIYVTIRLLDDRRLLGLPMDERIYETLLNQFKVNTKRVYSLGNKKADYANFIISKALLDQYFPVRKYHSTRHKETETALLNGDFRRFVLSCIYL